MHARRRCACMAAACLHGGSVFASSPCKRRCPLWSWMPVGHGHSCGTPIPSHTHRSCSSSKCVCLVLCDTSIPSLGISQNHKCCCFCLPLQEKLLKCQVPTSCGSSTWIPNQKDWDYVSQLLTAKWCSKLHANTVVCVAMCTQGKMWRVAPVSLLMDTVMEIVANATVRAWGACTRAHAASTRAQVAALAQRSLRACSVQHMRASC